MEKALAFSPSTTWTNCYRAVSNHARFFFFYGLELTRPRRGQVARSEEDADYESNHSAQVELLPPRIGR